MPSKRFLANREHSTFLAAVASKFHKCPSELIGIADRAVAFAFDLRCGEMLIEFEAERESIRLAAMSGGMLSNALGGSSGSQVDRSGPVALDA